MKYYIQDGTICMITVENEKVNKGYIYHKAYRQEDNSHELIDITDNEKECNNLVKWFVKKQKGKSYKLVCDFISNCPYTFNKKNMTETMIDALSEKHNCSKLEALSYIGNEYAYANSYYNRIATEIISNSKTLTLKEKNVMAGMYHRSIELKENKDTVLKLLDIDTNYKDELELSLFGPTINHEPTFASNDYRSIILRNIRDIIEYRKIKDDDIKMKMIYLIEELVGCEKKAISQNASFNLSSLIEYSNCLTKDHKIKLIEVLLKDINKTTRKDDISFKIRWVKKGTIRGMGKKEFEDAFNKLVTSSKVISVMADEIID